MSSRILSILLSGAFAILLAGIGIEPAIAQPQRGLDLEASQPVSQLPASSKRFALIIGIDSYTDRHLSPLSGSSNDAKELKDALIKYAGFPADQVILLASNSAGVREPNRGAILQALSNLRGLIPQDGLLLVAYSGHGIERDGHAYLLPSDAIASRDVTLLEDTAISVDRMRSLITATKVGQVVMLLDACRNDPVAGRADADNNLTNAYTKAFNFDLRNREVKAFVTLYATEIGHRAYEYTEKNQGYFSWALIEGLKGRAANERHEVTLGSLVKYVQEKVPFYVRRDLGDQNEQRPFANSEGYKADELVLSVASGRGGTDTDVGALATRVLVAEPTKANSRAVDAKRGLDSYNDGARLLEKGSVPEAEAAFRQAITSEPESKYLAYFYCGLGSALLAQNRGVEAEAAYRKSLTASGGSELVERPLQGLGQALLNQGKFAEAEDAFRRGIGIKSNSAILHYLTGYTMSKLSEPEVAASEMRLAVSLEPGNSVYLTGVGYVLAEAGIKLDEALRVLTESIKLNPGEPQAEHYIGLVYYKMGDLMKAEPYLASAAAGLPNEIKAQERLGDIYRDLGKIQVASVQWQKALNLAQDAATRERITRKLQGKEK